MGSAVESRGTYDVTALPHVLRRALVLGLITAIVVVLLSFITRLTSGVVETVAGGLVLLAGLTAVTVLPGLWTRARTIEGIAGAAAIGLAATVVFLLIDVALLQPFGIYTNRWREIGGGSNWWYHPVWWMAGTYLSSLLFRVDLDDPKSFWETFVANTYFGWIVLAAVIAGQFS